jgi:hypothetical protein
MNPGIRQPIGRVEGDAKVSRSPSATQAPTTAAGPLALTVLLTRLLGALWLVDGILQLQPAMFGPDFAQNILADDIPGQPAFMVSLLNLAIDVFDANPVLANAAAAAIQLAIGVLLLFPVARGWRRAALWASVVWSVLVWVFSEAAGNLLTGSASFYTGAPGSVLLYLIIALALLYPDRLPPTRLPQVAGVVFLLGAALNAFPTFWSDGNAAQALFGASQGDPSPVIAFPANALADVATSPVIVNLVSIGLLVLFGLLLLVRPDRLVGTVTIVFLALVWWISQDFGGITTFPSDTATDPNSAVPLIFMVLPSLYSATQPGWGRPAPAARARLS